MKYRKHTRTLVQEIISNGIGWIAGLLSADLVSYFFTIRSWRNLWGLFSRKTIVSSQLYEIIIWSSSAIVGFIVLVIVNRIVANWLLNKINDEAKETNKVNETDKTKD